MAQTPNFLITEIAANQNQKEVTANTAFVELEAAVSDIVTIAMPDSDYTLTSMEGGQALGNFAFFFTGTITAQRNVIVPTNKKLYAIFNDTNPSLGFSLVVKTLSGTGVTITTSSAYSLVYCDGVNVVAVGQAGSGSGTVTATSGALNTHQVVLGNGGDDIKTLGASGTSGQVLTSSGSSADPTWQTPASTAATVNPQTASYTPVLGDANNIVTMNVGSANTFTVPPHSSVAFPVGTVIEVVQLGTGQTSFLAGGGVTVSTPSSLNARTQYSTIAVTQVATDVWIAGGDLS